MLRIKSLMWKLLVNNVKLLEISLSTTENDISKYDKLYRQEKTKVKSATDLEGKFRAELLKIKSENNL